jgi:glycosyltransferase involved in cell wall biosynthesis
MKIRVLHIIKSLGRGGAEMLLPETLRLHDQKKFEFHYIYFLPWKNQMADEIQKHGGILTCMPAHNNIQLILKVWSIVQYVRDHKIQLIHAHLPWAGVVARMVGKMTSVKVIYTEHNKQERYHFATRLMNLATMNWLSRIIAVSHDVQESIQKHKKNLRPTLQVLLNGVNTFNFSPGLFSGEEIKKKFAIAPEAPVIGTVAVFRFQKRLDLWLEIAREISKKIPEAHFIIVGDGPLKNELLKKAESLSMEQIHFAGLQTDVRPYLAAMDIYMMTSIFEGLPVALLEAMACGCTPVSTDAGGIKEVITHGTDGLLCSVNEPMVLVEYAIDLLHNDVKCKRLGDTARRKIEDSFSLSKMVNELEVVYNYELGV